MEEREEEEEGCSRLGLGEGLPASTGGVLSGFCPGSEGTEKGGGQRGEEGGAGTYSIWIHIKLFNSLSHCLILCNWFNFECGKA